MSGSEARTHLGVIASSGTKVDVEQVIRVAEDELKALLTQRTALLKRLAIVRHTIAGLAEIFGDDVLTEDLRLAMGLPYKARRTGLTEACRAALNSSSEPLTARELVDRIRANNGALIQNLKTPLASVTSILHRLGSYGEATTKFNQSGQLMWASVDTRR